VNPREPLLLAMRSIRERVDCRRGVSELSALALNLDGAGSRE